MRLETASEPERAGDLQISYNDDVAVGRADLVEQSVTVIDASRSWQGLRTKTATCSRFGGMWISLPWKTFLVNVGAFRSREEPSDCVAPVVQLIPSASA